MTALQRRLIIAIDEWLGAALLLYLHRAGDPAFWPVFAAWAVLVSVISYPTHWRRCAREEREAAR